MKGLAGLAPIAVLVAALVFAPVAQADIKALEEADREAYDIAWVQDKASPVDTINGFVEVYMDARGIKGAWESLVYCVNEEKTSQIVWLFLRSCSRRW